MSNQYSALSAVLFPAPFRMHDVRDSQASPFIVKTDSECNLPLPDLTIGRYAPVSVMHRRYMDMHGHLYRDCRYGTQRKSCVMRYVFAL
jgi:hypothetical protein